MILSVMIRYSDVLKCLLMFVIKTGFSEVKKLSKCCASDGSSVQHTEADKEVDRRVYCVKVTL